MGMMYLKMIYYEILKLIRNKAAVRAWLVLFLIHAVGAIYAAEGIGGEGFSCAQAGEEAKAWAGMSAAEALLSINRACDVYHEQISGGRMLTEDDYIRGVILSEEKLRLEQLSGYQDYREEIRASAKAMDQVNFFGGSDSFTRRVAQKTSRAYEKLSLTELTSDYPGGIRLIINNRQTQAALFLAALAFAMLIFLQDQDSGMLPLLFSKRTGRRRAALAKMAALWVVSALTCLLFYGSNVLLAWKLVGLGDLHRPVQTLTGFYTSPCEISVGAYLLLFPVCLIFAQAAVGALFGCLCVLLRNGKLAAAVIGAVCAVELLFAEGAAGWLKYFNLVTLVDPNVFFSDYVCVNFFGIPVHLWAVGMAAFLFLAVGSSAGVVVCYTMQKSVPSVLFVYKKSLHKQVTKGRRQVMHPVTGKEAAKLLYDRGGLYLALALLVGQLVFWGGRHFWTTPEVFYYRAYAAEFAGVVSEQTDIAIKEEEERLDTSRREEQLYEALQQGTITQDEYDAALGRIQTDGFQLKAFTQMKQQYENVKELAADIPTIEIIDQTGWSVLLGKDGTVSNLLCLMLVLACEILLFSAYGVHERSTGVDLLITASHMGHKAVYHKKELVVLGQSAVFAVFGFLPRWLRIYAYYGLDGCKAPAASLLLRAVPASVTMVWLLCLSAALLVFLCVCAGDLTWKISVRCSSVYGAVFVSSACFLLPVAMLLLFFLGKG